MLSLDTLWDFFKSLGLPLIAVAWGLFKSKSNKLEKDIEGLKSSIEAIEKDNIQTKATYATKTELNKLLVEINRSLQENNVSLEGRLEKLMDLKNAPIKDLLARLVDKSNI